MGLLVAAGIAAPGVVRAQPVDLFYERTVMTQADLRCGLFAPEVGAALAAGAAQARGAALRAGMSADSLRSVEVSARAKADGAACTAPDLAIAATRVRTAFSGYAKLSRLTYTGDVAEWRADRNITKAARWRLIQETTFGADHMAFGLAGRDGSAALIAVARFADGAEPYAARLVLRNSSRSAQPYLDRWGGGATAGLPLARRLPPASALKAYAASARSSAGPELMPPPARNAAASEGWAFRFPDAAALDLAGLDPREAVAVEFLFPGDGVRRAYVEVGDFAAGRAFLQVAAR